ncbi:hypothetical protein nbrc107696_22510 [Gordonia spumicola]|uniref:Uncharacterized protein n=1 Tax=Gordonia spumicola TaxID=589161 RepID=A0A7I9V925_9ACTN|nr:hypothetical protein [Gordonia spumicola]GEE01649.1 hypothetical protein nbrc107696_20950 [Gordonia spumicola]GEE01805.1 hypothetical protein nbrc107696_22510 [Gordonia spumicola]
MRVRCADPGLATALAAVVPDEGAGLVFVADGPLATWDDTEAELAEVFRLTQPEVVENGPILYVVTTSALLGRAAPLDSAVADGLLAGARALAFERARFDGYASVIAVGDGVDDARVAEAAKNLLTTRASNGQPFMLGSEHLGAALP